MEKSSDVVDIFFPRPRQ